MTAKIIKLQCKSLQDDDPAYYFAIDIDGYIFKISEIQYNFFQLETPELFFQKICDKINNKG